MAEYYNESAPKQQRNRRHHFMHRQYYSQIKPASSHLIVTIFMLIFGKFPTITLGYRMGEVINLLIQSSSSQSSSLSSSFHNEKHAKNIDALRNQMPRFGISSSTSIDSATLQLLPTLAEQQLQRQKLSMTMVFGAKILPWINVYESEGNGSSNDVNYDEKIISGSKILDSLTVTFIYNTHTRHGKEGDIHSIRISKATYADFDFRTNIRIMREEIGGGDDSPMIQVRYEWIEDADLDMPSGIVLMECIAIVTLLLMFIRVCSIEEGDGYTGNRNKEGNDGNRIRYTGARRHNKSNHSVLKSD